jgi:valyl-tRNA synthetase
MKEYSFATATGAIHGFFLYELCDYYLELVKPVMQGDKAAAADAGGDVALASQLARTTLHVCLEHGFRLLHPMMPFVTEELWQRLPGRGRPLRAAAGAPADPRTIMLAAYPSTPLPTATRPDVEASFTLFQAAVRAGRSLRADADIAPSKQATFYITAGDAATRTALEAQRADIATLLRTDGLHIVDEGSPVEEGCSAAVVSDKCTVHLLLKGLIDPAAEIVKLERKHEKVAKDVDRLKRLIAGASYEEKVPADVRALNAEQLAANLKQGETLQVLMAQYRAWLPQ